MGIDLFVSIVDEDLSDETRAGMFWCFIQAVFSHICWLPSSLSGVSSGVSPEAVVTGDQMKHNNTFYQMFLKVSTQLNKTFEKGLIICRHFNLE